MNLTAREVNRAIYRHFAGDWAVLFEVVGVSRADGLRLNGERRVDALLVRRSRRRSPARRPTKPAAGGLFAAPAVRFDGDDGGLERIALEVKVTRADFTNDVARPEKQAPWREITDRHAYVVPSGLVAEAEVPAESGLLVVECARANQPDSGLRCRWARRAPRHPGGRPLPWPILMDAIHRTSRAEAQLRGYAFGSDDQDEETLRAAVKRLTHDLGSARNEVAAARERSDAWRKRYAQAAPNGVPCAACGKPLRPTRAGRVRWDKREWHDWEHCAELDHSACELIRTAAWMQGRAAATAAADVNSEDYDERFGRFSSPEKPWPAEPAA